MTGDYSISIGFTAYYSSNSYVNGTLVLKVTDGGSGGDLTISTTSDKAVRFDKSDFYKFYDDNTSSGSLRYVEFDTGSSFGSTYGYIYYNYDGSGETRFSNSSIDNYKFYYSSSSYGDYPLGSLYFVPGSHDGDYSISIGFTAYYSSNSYVNGTLVLKVTDGGSGGDLTISTTSDKAVRFDKSDFYKFYDDNTSSGSLRYVEFDTGSSFGSTYGYIYYNYDGSGETRFSNSSIDNYKFYYSSSSYGDYPLGSLYFVPGSHDGDYSISIGFTAYYSSNSYVNGTLVLKVTDGGSGGDLTISTTSDKAVRFDKSDFYKFYDDNTSSGSLRYVEFDTGSSFGSTYGYIYYNYDGSGETRFSNSSIDNYKFYYSSSSYGDYPLGSLYFVPGSHDGDYSISIGFTAYYSSNSYVNGTLVLKVTDGGSGGDLTISTTSDKAVRFDKSDFYKFYDDNTSSGSLRYVEFDTGSSFGSTYGYIYYNYDGSGETRFSNSSIDNYKFYYSSSSYGDYPLGSLYFVPGSHDGDYSISIGFTAYYSSNSYVNGTLVLKVTDGGSIDKSTIIYNTTYGNAITINAIDIADYFSDKHSSYNLKYVKLTGLPDAGSLYYNYSKSVKLRKQFQHQAVQQQL